MLRYGSTYQIQLIYVERTHLEAKIGRTQVSVVRAGLFVLVYMFWQYLVFVLVVII